MTIPVHFGQRLMRQTRQLGQRPFLLAPCLLLVLLGFLPNPDSATASLRTIDTGPAAIVLDVPNSNEYSLGLSQLASSPDRLYLAGVSSSGMDLDPGPDEYLYPAGTFFVAQYDSAFAFRWAISWRTDREATQRSCITKLLTDNNGNLFCLAMFDGSLGFQDTGNEPIPIASRGLMFPLMMLLKIDDSGNILWERTWEGLRDEFFEYWPSRPTMALDNECSIYVIANPFELRKYNPDGLLEWCYCTDIQGNAVACDSHGNVYLGGYYMDDSYYEGTKWDLGRRQSPLLPLLSVETFQGYNDQSVVLKLDGAGYFLWVVAWPGTPLPQVAVRDDKLYAVDRCRGNDAKFAASDGRVTELNGQGFSIVMRISNAGALEWWSMFSSTTWFFGIYDIKDSGIYVGGWQSRGVKVGATEMDEAGWYLMKVEDDSLEIVASSISEPSPPWWDWHWNRVQLAPDYHGGAFLATATKKHSTDPLAFDTRWEEEGPSDGLNLLVLRLANL